MVRIAGAGLDTTMPYDAAKAAGLLDSVVEANVEGFKSAVAAPGQAAAQTSRDGQDNTNSDDNGLRDVSAPDQISIADAASALETASQILGQHAVDSIQMDVVST